jgi:hypothetical protein
MQTRPFSTTGARSSTAAHQMQLGDSETLFTAYSSRKRTPTLRLKIELLLVVVVDVIVHAIFSRFFPDFLPLFSGYPSFPFSEAPRLPVRNILVYARMECRIVREVMMVVW